MSDNVHSIFEPNPSVIRSHLERLFRRVRTEYPEGWCEIIWTDDRGRPTQTKWFSCSPMGLDAATDCAILHNKERRNLYVGVNPRKPQCAPFGRASAADVEISFFQFVDADSAEAAARVRRAPLPYTWVVMTGKTPNPRPHAYWELDEPIRNMDAWRSQQRAMAVYFGSDAVVDPPRIMRLAGTINFPNEKKRGQGYRIEEVTLRTLYDDEERDPVSSEALFHAYPWIAESAYQGRGYDPETGEFDEFDEKPPGSSPGAGSRPDFDAYRPIDPQVYVRNIERGFELHNNARDLIDHLISTGHRTWLVRDYLVKLLTPVSDGGTLGQVDEMIRSWRQKTDIPDPPDDYEDFDAPPPPGRGLPLEWFGDVQPNLDAADFVEGLLCEAGLSVLYGESNCGKTFFMTDLAFHIATGRTWRGHAIERGGVIYVALEGGFGIRNRLTALRLHYQPDGVVALGVVAHSVNLLDADADTRLLIDLVRDAALFIDMPIKLVVIDTLSRALNGGNENAPEDMGSIVKAADRIREGTGAHVVFVHHSGKDQAKGARGHSLLRAATDTEIEIVRPEGAARSVATVKKQRELEINGEFAFELKQIQLGVNKRGKAVTSCIVVEGKAEERGPRVGNLNAAERDFWDEIREMFNRGDHVEMVAPEPKMPVMRVINRCHVRDWMIRRGRIDVTERDDGVTALSANQRQYLSRMLKALVSKGYLEMNREWVWRLI